MNKKKILLIIAFVCIVVGGVATAVGYKMSGGLHLENSLLSYVGLDEKYEIYTYMDMEVDSFDGIDIVVSNCNITFQKSTNGKYGVDVKLVTDELEHAKVSVTDKTLKVRNEMQNGVRFSFGNTENSHIVIYYPEDVVFGNVYAKTSNSRISVSDMNTGTGRMELVSSNGNIELNGVYSEAITLTTSNSKIILKNVFTDSISASTSNGNIEGSKVETESGVVSTSNAKIEFTDAYGVDFKATTSNGNVEFSNVFFSDTLEIKTSNDKIDLLLDGSKDDFLFVTSTSNDSVFIDGKKMGKEYKGGTGKATVSARSSNGNIRIDFK